MSPRLNRHAIRTPGDRLPHDDMIATDVTSHRDYERLARLPNLDAIPVNQMVAQLLYMSMTTKEQWWLEKSFAAALGEAEPYPQATRAELLESLTEDYRVFDLARGRHSTERLLKDLEKDAQEQARQWRGQGSA